jgi:Amt family ammonium transporter
MDTGATAWLLASTGLVLLMTPGVAFFYGGMVRGSNVLGILMQSFTTVAVVTLSWMLLGFSLAFGSGNGLVGDLDFVGLVDLPQTLPVAPAVPTVVFAAFQLMFAIVTPVLITGATAERWRFGAFVPFVALWSVVVYAPVAHWVFSPQGWAARWGALDFAGGTVVHVNAGAAALAMALLLGRRRGWPHNSARPHNLTLVMLGTALLWFGWFGFNAGSAYGASGLAGTALLNTQISASAGLLAWIGTERVRYGKPTTLGAASGVVAGLVAVTPAAGYVNPVGALGIGLVAGIVCQLTASLKTWLRVDDSLDVVAVHLGAGFVGSVLVGLLATRSVNPDGADGLFYGGGYGLLVKQAGTVLAVAAFSFVVTVLLAAVVDRIIGNRASAREEAVGLDLSQHGEVAYHDLSPTASVRAAPADQQRPVGHAAVRERAPR